MYGTHIEKLTNGLDEIEIYHRHDRSMRHMDHLLLEPVRSVIYMCTLYVDSPTTTLTHMHVMLIRTCRRLAVPRVKSRSRKSL